MLLHEIRSLRLKQPDFLLSTGTTKDQAAHVDVDLTTAILRDANAQIGNLFLPRSVRAGFANLLAIMSSTSSPTTSWKRDVYLYLFIYYLYFFMQTLIIKVTLITNMYVDISYMQNHGLDSILCKPL